MTPHPQRGSPGRNTLLALKRLARDTGKDVQELLTLYALEAFLARLAASKHQKGFVLKGGVLLAAYEMRRPTKDIDFHINHLASLSSKAQDVVREISQIPLKDGVVFETNRLLASPIREADDYEGIRVKLEGSLDRSRLRIGIDMNIGDPIWPPPQTVSIPRLLDQHQPPINLLGYPLTMVIAEKATTFIERGIANTRWRDFADLYQIIHRHEIDGTECLASLMEVSRFRGVPVTPVRSLLRAVGEKGASKWVLWHRRAHRGDDLPEDMREVMETLANFFDGLFQSPSPVKWDHLSGRWSQKQGRS